MKTTQNAIKCKKAKNFKLNLKAQKRMSNTPKKLSLNNRDRKPDGCPKGRTKRNTHQKKKPPKKRGKKVPGKAQNPTRGGRPAGKKSPGKAKDAKS